MEYNILLATGRDKVDNAIVSSFKHSEDINIFPAMVYFREGLLDLVMRFNPNIIVISDYLDGSTLSQKQLIQTIRVRYPNIRIVYMTRDEKDIRFKKFLCGLGIYDFMSIFPKLDLKLFNNIIRKPKGWPDVVKYFSNLDPSESFGINEEFILNSDRKEINNNYSDYSVKRKSNENTLKQVISCWGVREQSGTTMLASNLSMLLGKNESNRILVIDLNINNPNMHLHLSTPDVDGNRNLAAFIQDLDNNDINDLSEVKNYILAHKFFPNVHILPGYILRQGRPNTDIFNNAIDVILDFAKKVGYNTVILDAESGLDNPYSIDILKKSDKVMMPFIETPGAIIAYQKFFDSKWGRFYDKKLDLNNFYPILNQATFTSSTEKIVQLIGNVINRNVYAKIPSSEDIHLHVVNGLPIMKERPEDKVLNGFINAANCINDVFETIEEQPQKKAKGILSNFATKK